MPAWLGQNIFMCKAALLIGRDSCCHKNVYGNGPPQTLSTYYFLRTDMGLQVCQNYILVDHEYQRKIHVCSNMSWSMQHYVLTSYTNVFPWKNCLCQMHSFVVLAIMLSSLSLVLRSCLIHTVFSAIATRTWCGHGFGPFSFRMHVQFRPCTLHACSLAFSSLCSLLSVLLLHFVVFVIDFAVTPFSVICLAVTHPTKHTLVGPCGQTLTDPFLGCEG